MNDLQTSALRNYTRSVSSTEITRSQVQGHPIFDINFATFRSQTIQAKFEKFNFENLVDDVISNGDFHVFNVHTIMDTNFDKIMENSFGKTLPENIKIKFIQEHIKHWSDLSSENCLNCIPNDIQNGKVMNWRFYQGSTILSSPNFTDYCKNWIILMKRQACLQAFSGDSSYFFAGGVGRQTMTDQFPELLEQYKKSPFPNNCLLYTSPSPRDRG